MESSVLEEVNELYVDVPKKLEILSGKWNNSNSGAC